MSFHFLSLSIVVVNMSEELVRLRGMRNVYLRHEKRGKGYFGDVGGH